MTRKDGDHQPSGAPTALAFGLSNHCDELFALMMSGATFDADDPHGCWLRDRYAEIVPMVLPDVLRSVETGIALTTASRQAIRQSAMRARQSDIPLTVVLRGAVPAMRAFGVFVQSWDHAFDARELAVVMGRASLIALELGACWAEAWLGDAPRPIDGDSLELVAVPGEVKSPALEMLALAASGRSNDQIAEETAYSPQAVKWHLARIMRAWRVSNRAALISVAFVRGVVVTRTARPARSAERPADKFSAGP